MPIDLGPAAQPPSLPGAIYNTAPATRLSNGCFMDATTAEGLGQTSAINLIGG
jgi:hypothetical protein